jgi:hypothetical protein
MLRMGYLLVWDSDTGSQGQLHQPPRGGANGGCGVFGMVRLYTASSMFCQLYEN